MFIRATTITIEEHEVHVINMAEFRSRFPNAEIQSIDGTRADGLCEKGHPFMHEHGCRECYRNEKCLECGHKNRDCECMPF